MLVPGWGHVLLLCLSLDQKGSVAKNITNIAVEVYEEWGFCCSAHGWSVSLLILHSSISQSVFLGTLGFREGKMRVPLGNWINLAHSPCTLHCRRLGLKFKLHFSYEPFCVKEACIKENSVECITVLLIKNMLVCFASTTYTKICFVYVWVTSKIVWIISVL